VLAQLQKEFPDQVRIIYRHYPLIGTPEQPFHDKAALSAQAAEAAGKQGMFWEMHDLLFENQRSLEPADLERLATELGLDMARFRADMASAETQRIIDANKAAGRELDVSGTPTIFVNGRRFREHPRALPSYIREELDQ
jgi:protein-disulfide isomerase